MENLDYKATGKQIKHVRADNGLEFYGDAFNKFWKDHGFVGYHILKHTPQQNRFAEQMNRT